MGMKPLLYAMFAVALLFAANSATAADSTASIYTGSPAANHPLNSNVLPVLVRVSKQGKVTYVAPAYELRQQYLQLLRTSLGKMITQPAHDKRGDPVASEFVMYLTGKTTKREDGKYDFQFAYLSARPVPFGNWFWGQFASGQLALLSPDTTFRPFPGNGFRNGSCYYERYYYSQCVVFTCAYYHACNACTPQVDSNTSCKDSNQSKAADGQIQAEATHVYRLYRPRVTQGFATRRAGATRFQNPNAAQARRFGPVGPVTQQSPAMQNNPVAPMIRPGMGNGAARSAPAEPALRGGRNR